MKKVFDEVSLSTEYHLILGFKWLEVATKLARRVGYIPSVVDIWAIIQRVVKVRLS
jgi:hypothetical protein